MFQKAKIHPVFYQQLTNEQLVVTNFNFFCYKEVKEI